MTELILVPCLTGEAVFGLAFPDSTFALADRTFFGAGDFTFGTIILLSLP